MCEVEEWLNIQGLTMRIERITTDIATRTLHKSETFHSSNKTDTTRTPQKIPSSKKRFPSSHRTLILPLSSSWL
jgi:hypothetical protein